MPDTPTPGAQTTTLQVMTYNALNDSHTLVLDLNDHGAFTLRPQGLAMPQPPKADSRSSNLRTPGEKVVTWQYKNRHITVQLNLRALTPSDLTSTTQLLTDIRNLLAAVEHPPYELRIALPKATQYSYADVVQCTHTIPSDPQEILAGAIRTVAIDFECLPGLRGDRLTLQNLVFNPGFEAPSGPAVTAFADTFANFNAYTVQAGGALTQDSTYYADVVLADSPIRYYRLDESSGTTSYDAGTQQQNGTTHGSPTQGVTGLLASDPDTCYTFASASSQYVSASGTGLPTGAGAFTVEAWVKFASNPAANAYIGSWGNATTNNLNVQMWIDNAGMAHFGTTGTAIASGALSTGTAHHIVGTYDGANLRLYADGSLVAGPTAATLNIPSGPSFAFGAAAWSLAGTYFNGQLDECAVYATALSSTRISAHYSAGHAAPVANQANTMVIPSGGRVSFGSPIWESINLWQTRFRATAAGTYTWYLHYTDASNYLAAVVTQTSLTLNHVVGGTTHQLATTSPRLVPGVPYWLTVTQFPFISTAGVYAMVQAQLFTDNAGAISATSASSAIGPVATNDAVTALSGAPQIAASGAALALGGSTATNPHRVQLFRPGSWSLTNAGTGTASLSVDASTTTTSGPVTSFRAARLDAAPAGTLDAKIQLYTGGAAPTYSAAGTWAIPVSAAGDVLYAACAVRSSGLGNGATVKLDCTESNASGSSLRSGTLQTLTISGGTQINWPASGASSLSGHWTTGANCAYVDLALHVADTTSGSASGTVWFDNVQCWDATTTGQTSMGYHELAFSQGYAQLMVSGLAGDMPAPAFVALGTYQASFAPGGQLSYAIGRRAQSSASAQLVGPSYGLNFWTNVTYALSASSYGGFYHQLAMDTTGAFMPRAFSAVPSAFAGVYHLMSRVWTNQSTGNLGSSGNVYTRIFAPQVGSGWFGNATGSDFYSGYLGSNVYPISTGSTWTNADNGQVWVPPYAQGALTDPAAIPVVPRGQWFDSTGGGSTGRADGQLLLPIDTGLVVGTINNPSNSGITFTGDCVFAYLDGLNALQSGSGTWSSSIETTLLANPAHGTGGPGTTSSGYLNVNSSGDTYLTLDPKPLGLAGVNQFGAYLLDASVNLLPLATEMRYVPQYLYPR